MRRQVNDGIKRLAMNDKQYFVYILASKRNGTLYAGVTSNLIKRVSQHKQNKVECFTKKYSVHILVYYEVYKNIDVAITCEKRIKKWNRKWKMELIEGKNPEWDDLYLSLGK